MAPATIKKRFATVPALWPGLKQTHRKVRRETIYHRNFAFRLVSRRDGICNDIRSDFFCGFQTHKLKLAKATSSKVRGSHQCASAESFLTAAMVANFKTKPAANSSMVTMARMSLASQAAKSGNGKRTGNAIVSIASSVKVITALFTGQRKSARHRSRFLRIVF